MLVTVVTARVRVVEISDVCTVLVMQSTEVGPPLKGSVRMMVEVV